MVGGKIGIGGRVLGMVDGYVGLNRGCVEGGVLGILEIEYSY